MVPVIKTGSQATKKTAFKLLVKTNSRSIAPVNSKNKWLGKEISAPEQKNNKH